LSKRQGDTKRQSLYKGTRVTPKGRACTRVLPRTQNNEIQNMTNTTTTTKTKYNTLILVTDDTTINTGQDEFRRTEGQNRLWNSVP